MARAKPAAPASTAPARIPEPPPAETPAAPDTRVTDTHAVWLPLADVRKWNRNPRINTDAVPKVADSIRAFGFVSPAVVWEGQDRLVAGHTRIAALESILAVDPTFIPKGASPGVRPGMIPVRFHPFASEAEADAYAIADNRLNEVARWDVPVLQDILAGLDSTLASATGFDLSALALPDLSSMAGVSGAAAEAAPTDDTPKKERDPQARVVHYDLIFDNDAQQTAWEDYLRALRSKYPTEGTIAARIARDLEDRPLARS